MIGPRDFETDFARLLPDTAALLVQGGLALHPAVSRVVLHGSRGLAGGYRSNSDIDLSLLVDPAALGTAAEPETLLQSIIHETLCHWSGPVELDIAAIFDTARCGLDCFERRVYDPDACQIGGIDCFGVYKIQKGFDGYVRGAGIEVRRMVPCLVIWRSPVHTLR